MTERRVVLVGCGKDKMPTPAPARDLYVGPLFQKTRAFAEQSGDQWLILSAKHFLVQPDTVLDPYDFAMSQRDKIAARAWASVVDVGLRCTYRLNPQQDCSALTLTILAGDDYVRPLRGVMDHHEWVTFDLPLAGMGVGRRLQWLARQLGSSGRESSDG